MVAAALLGIGSPPKARAANIFWDSNGVNAGVGGAGTWDLAATTWVNAGNDRFITGTGATSAYTFTDADTAYFGGAGGAVTGTDTIAIGGLVFTSASYSLGSGLTLAFGANTPTLTTNGGGLGAIAFASTVINSALTGTNGFRKQGGGNLILTNANAGLSGAITIDAGTLEVGTVATSLGSGSVTLNAGATLSLISTTAFTLANSLTIAGPATINSGSDIDKSSGIARTLGGTVSIANTTLNFNNANRQFIATTLSAVSNQDGDDLNFNGAITLQGLASTFLVTQTEGNPDYNISGQLTGAGALTLIGAGGGAIQNATNNLSGGINIFSSWRGFGSAASPGTGPVVFGPSTTNFIRGSANVTGASSFNVLSSLGNISNVYQHPTAGTGTVTMSNMGGLFLDTNFNLDALQNVRSGPYGSTLLPMMGTWGSNPIDMSKAGTRAAGNGAWFLGTGSNAAVNYTAASLGADAGVYRLGAGGGTGVLTISTANVLTGAATLVVGNPLARAGLLGGVATGTVNLNNVQDYTGSTTVNRGSSLQITNTTLQNIIPIGSTLNVSGYLLLQGDYTGSGPRISNTAFNIFNTGFGVGAGQLTGLVIGNAARTTNGTNVQLSSTAAINLSNGNIRFTGTTAANTSAQTVGTVNLQGGSFIGVEQGNALADNAVFTISNLVRQNAGVLTVLAGTTALGSSQKLVVTNVNGAAPIVSNGMVAPWIIDHTSANTPTFVTTGANGLVPIAYDVTAATAGGTFTSTALQKVDITAAQTLTAAVSVQALRVRDVAISGAFNITVGASAATGEAAGVIFGALSNRAHANNWVFGTFGAREAVMYASTANVWTDVNGIVNATGLTKAGPGNVALYGNNTSLLTGVITVNQGDFAFGNPFNIGTRANPTSPYQIDAVSFVLAGGRINSGGLGVNSNNVNYLANVTVLNDSGFYAGPTNGASRFGSLTFAARQGGAVDPTMLTIEQGLIFTGATTLNQAAWLRTQTATTGVNATFLVGAVGGSASLEKFGPGTLALLSGASTMTGPITVHQGNLISLVSSSTATPFGTSTVTVNPGAGVQLGTSNVGGGLTLTNDLTGLATLSLGYVGAVPAFTSNYTNTSSAFSGVIGLGVVGYNLAIDQNALGDGRTFLGSLWAVNNGTGVVNSASANFTGSIVPSTVTTLASSGFASLPAGSVYRLGGGGSTLNFNRANILTGANNVVIGAISAAIQANSTTLQGGGGTIVLNAANDYSGFTTFNLGQTVQIGHNNAFGTSTLIFNGGTLNGDAYNRNQAFTAGRQIANAAKFAGDATFTSTFNGQPTDLTFSGNVGLSNDPVGGSLRTITVNTATYAQANGSIVTFSGVISDGDSAYNSLNKSGAGTLRLTGTNTYTGVTMISAGNILITQDANLGANPLVNLTGGTLSIWEQNMTLGKTLNFITNSNLDVADGFNLTQGSAPWTGAANLHKIGSGFLTLTEANAFATLTILGGQVSVSRNDQLGLGTVIFNNVNANYGTGGVPVLRFTESAIVNRVLSATTAGAVSVDGGKTVTLTLSGSTGTLVKLGAGIVDLAVQSATAPTWNIHQGILRIGNYTTGALTPFSNASPILAGGTLQLNATTGDLTVNSGNGSLNFSGGGIVNLASTGAFNSELTVQNLIRSGQGTLIVAPTANLGSATVSTQRSRLVVNSSGQIFSQGIATALFNGILSPVIVRTADGQLSGDANFVTWDATNGLITGTPTTAVTTLAAQAPTAVATISTPQTLTGFNSIYAFRTTADVSGGTIRIVSNGASHQLGGILLNGAGLAAPVISSNLFFGRVNNSPHNGIFTDEAVIYAGGGYASGVPTLSGAISARGLTKFGAGTVRFAGDLRPFIGSLTVQSGAVQFVGDAAQPASVNLVLNDAGSIDLNGGLVKVGSLTGTAGLITNSAATAGTLVMVGANGTTFNGSFQNGTGSVSIIKGGTATLTLDDASNANPFSNVNTQAGFTLRSGQINLNTPTGLGDNASTLTLQGGLLNLNMTGVGPGLPMVVGTRGATTGGISVVVNGTGTSIATDNNGVFNTGFTDVYFQFGNLTLGNSWFGAQPSTDTQNLRFAGAITGGNAAVFNVVTPGNGRSVVDLSGVIQDTPSANLFALNKQGGGTLRVSSGANTYTGGTNVLAGVLQVSATSGNPLGTGPVIVNPNTALRLAAASSVGSASSVTVLSTPYNFGILALDGDFTPTGGAFTTASMASPFGGAVQIALPNFTGTLNMGAIGDGRQYLGAFAGVGQLNAGSQFLGTLTAGADNRYRLGGGNTLWFAGADNVFTGASRTVEVGAPVSLFTGAQTVPGNSVGTVVVQNSNDYTGGTIINRSATLVVETGGAAAGSTPLGSGVVEVRQGSALVFRGFQGSAFNAGTSDAANVIRLRQSGLIQLDDNNAGATSGLFTGAGNQGRWGDSVGLTLDGGTFRLSGANNLDSFEKIGAITVGLGNGALDVNRNNSGTAVLEVASIARGTQRGVLWVNTAAAGSLNAASGFDRLRVTTALTNAGTTTNGLGVTTGGMVAPWIVDRTNQTFLSYQGPTLGLQPLLITAPAGGQVSFSSRGTTTIEANLLDGTATLYQSGATALAYNTSVYALRFDNNLSSVVATAVTGNLTRGSNVVTNSTTGSLRVGQPISGTGIMPNAVITEVIDGTNFRISYPAVRDGASVSLVPHLRADLGFRRPYPWRA
jgi:autotransporter-associated beta strand protein